MIELGDHPGRWCNLGAHDACSGTWQQVPCSCSCHVGEFTIDLLRSRVDLTISDRQTMLAFAAFLRYAGPRGPNGTRVPLNKPWHDWLTGKGPTPDPDSEVGPEPYEDTEACGGNA